MQDKSNGTVVNCVVYVCKTVLLYKYCLHLYRMISKFKFQNFNSKQSEKWLRHFQ